MKQCDYHRVQNLVVYGLCSVHVIPKQNLGGPEVTSEPSHINS